MTPRSLAVIACALLVMTACRGSLRPPDLGSIYNRVAAEHDEHRNPVIVIPGILGSRLTRPEDGGVVWGAFDRTGLDPEKPEGARAVALPMAEGRRLAELVDEVEPSGVLESFRLSLIGLPLELEAYAHILLTLGVGGYRDAAFAAEIDYGDDHFTCFQFDYDWRRSNVENARRFERFLEQRRAEVSAERERRFGVKDPDVRFDVIAHSMGGLLLRYFLRYGGRPLAEDDETPTPNWAGARHIDRAVLVAPPNAGAVDALRYLVEGRSFGPFTATYSPALLGTYPAMYELLPRARHRSIVDDRGEPMDPLDADTWVAEGWGFADHRESRQLEILLPALSPEARRGVALDHLRKSLENARRFHAALDTPAAPPPGLSLFLFAGDAEKTSAKARWNGRRLEVVAEAWGDGDVLRSSALMDERLDGSWGPTLRSPIRWQHVTFHFTDHLGITQDPAFTDNLLYLLLESPRAGAAAP